MRHKEKLEEHAATGEQSFYLLSFYFPDSFQQNFEDDHKYGVIKDSFVIHSFISFIRTVETK